MRTTTLQPSFLALLRAAALTVALTVFGLSAMPWATAQSPDRAPPAQRADPPKAEPHGGGKADGRADARQKGSPALKKLPETAAEKARVLRELYAHLATAEDEQTAHRIAGNIERLWLHSGSDTVNLLMQRALVAQANGKTDVAVKLLDYALEIAPDFAEGFNRRAFVHFARNDVEKAVGDLRRAIALDPNHFKALAGLAQIWRETGNKRGAFQVLRQLLDVHPFAQGVRQAVQELAKEVEGQGI